MTDETTVEAKAAAEAPAKVAKAVADTAKTIATESKKTAKRIASDDCSPSQAQGGGRGRAGKQPYRSPQTPKSFAEPGACHPGKDEDRDQHQFLQRPRSRSGLCAAPDAVR